jgi:dTDP-4-dehydrorhamnose 3,5-epimerase
MKFTLTPTPLDGVMLIDPEYYPDGRGFFLETWNQRDFAAAGLPGQFVQDSHSRSARGVLRGLHFQNLTEPMGKLVRCTVGHIFDVAVDLRVGSPTFGNWFGAPLSAENKRQIYIPVGFGHGFQALSDVVEVQYKQTGFYSPSAEGAVLWNDPDIGIDWPLENPTLSERDRRAVSLREYAGKPAFSYAPPNG